MRTKHSLALLLVLLTGLLIPAGPAAQESGLCQGQTLYVPVYSHIYSGDRAKPFPLTATLSIRNIDPELPITLIVVDYYETRGRLVKKYLAAPLVLAPLESVRYIVAESDKTGGSGANFIVGWRAGQPVNPPLVESIMIGAQTQQGISFTSRGRVIIGRERGTKK